MNLQTHKILETVDTQKILNEIDHLLKTNDHVWLQKMHEFVYDLPYTNSLLLKHNTYNTRIMHLEPKQCYTWHRDQTPRIHIPLTTNDKCKFIVEDVCFNLLIDNMYWVDTTKYHSAFNGNKDFDRYHIVGLTDELV